MQAGYRVFCTSRKAAGSNHSIAMLVCDVTDDVSARRMVDLVLAQTGRIVNMSSILGLIPAPFNALYAATKHAVEGYSESLDHELRADGIRVVLVEPGVTRTAFEENITRPDQPLALHDAQRARMEALMRNWITKGDAPEVVAMTVVKAATARLPKRRYTAGKQAGQVSWLRRFLPEAMVDRSLRKFNGLPV